MICNPQKLVPLSLTWVTVFIKQGLLRTFCKLKRQRNTSTAKYTLIEARNARGKSIRGRNYWQTIFINELKVNFKLVETFVYRSFCTQFSQQK